MKKFFAFFTQRWLWSLIACLALCALIYIYGPSIRFGESALFPAESPWRLWLLISLIMGAWVLSTALRFWRAKKRSEALAKSMTQTQVDPDDAQASETLNELSRRMEEALDTLKKTKVGRFSGNRALYELPWYIIIGPPGAGKTTLLKESDLNFPLTQGGTANRLSGVGGTRNCDWWFTDDAILLDTAGRYSTRSSNESVDKKEWLGFLDLLKKTRSRRPINGVIVAFSLTDLISTDPRNHAQLLRARIHELYERLGLRLPVYVIVTKCDMISGFDAFFSDLDAKERNQVWGTTLPEKSFNSEQSVEHLQQAIEALFQRVDEQVIEKLANQANLSKREQIYLFPQQLNSIKARLFSLLENTFSIDRYSEDIFVRGVYFSSATQMGSPIDRISARLSQSLGVDGGAPAFTPTGKGKAYFINDLLREVVFAESALAGLNLNLERKLTWMRRGAMAAMLALGVAITGLWGVSYSKNQTRVDAHLKGNETLAELAQGLDGKDIYLPNTLEVLDHAKSLESAQAGEASWGRMGLSQRQVLDQHAQLNYRESLESGLLPRLLLRLESHLMDSGGNNDQLYEGLRAYLMLKTPDKYDSDIVRSWFLNNLEHHSKNLSDADRDALAPHIVALFDKQPRITRPLDQTLIDNARMVLSAQPLEQRIYQRIKANLKPQIDGDFLLGFEAGRRAPEVFQRTSGQGLNSGVSAFFTAYGYQDFVAPEIELQSQKSGEDNWIFGQTTNPYQNQPERLKNAITRIYLSDFVKEWETFLGDISLVPIRDKLHASRMLQTLSGPESPLQLLLANASKATNLNREIPEEEKQKKKKSRALSLIKRFLPAKAKKALSVGKQVNRERKRMTGNSAEDPQKRENTEYLNVAFERLHNLTKGEEGKPNALTNLIQQLAELYTVALPALVNGNIPPTPEQRQAIQTAVLKLNQEATYLPAVAQNVVKATNDSVTDVVGAGVCAAIREAWQANVLTIYRQSIAGRFPVDARSTIDITADDFSRFFAPNGILDQFVNQYLSGFLRKTAKRWHWAGPENSPACVSPKTLAQLKRAKDLQPVFFPAGMAPSSRFSLTLKDMSADIQKVNFNFGGQPFDFIHGPQRFSPALSWPSASGNDQINIQASPLLVQGHSGYHFKGPWGHLRLAQKGHAQKITDTHFDLRLEFFGRPVDLTLQAASTLNPFTNQSIKWFRCPTTL